MCALTGGVLSGTFSGTTISATYMTANTFTGSGAELTNLIVSSATTGILSVSRGGTGTNYLLSNQILIGSGSLRFSCFGVCVKIFNISIRNLYTRFKSMISNKKINKMGFNQSRFIMGPGISIASFLVCLQEYDVNCDRIH